MAESLYRRGIGYTHDEEKIFQHKGRIIRVNTTKHYPPDTQAASLWLRNRQPTLWRDQKNIAIDVPKEERLTGPELIEALAEVDEEIAILEGQL